jgi:hypothetical protein
VQQPRESVGRTRFLLALSLSTVTAVAVAAPLALQAINGPDDSGNVVDPAGPGSADDLLSDEEGDRSLEGNGTPQGGIGARPEPKALSETGKGETTDETESGTDSTDGGATTTEAPVEEGSSGRPAPEQSPPVTDPSGGSSTTAAVPTVNPTQATTTTSTSTTSTTSTTAAPGPDVTGDDGPDDGG